MVRTFSSQTTCGVVVQWDRAPSQGSRPVSFFVEIQDHNEESNTGNWYSTHLDEFCDGTDPSLT